MSAEAAESPLHIARRFGWGLADQALSSLTNVVLAIMVARAVGASGFGAFSLAFATYFLSLGVSAALVSDPLVIRYSACETREWRQGVGRATGAALTLGIAAGIGCSAAGWAAGGPAGEAFVALGPVMPGLILQDTWRSAFFAAGRGHLAFLNDLVWAIVLVAALGVMQLDNAASVGELVLVWGGAATTAAVVGVFQARTVPRPLATMEWLRTQKDLGFPYLGEFAALSAGELALFGIGSVAGLAAVGAIRLGQVFLGPLRVLFLGTRLVAVPEGVRLLRRSPARLRRATGRLSVTLCVVVLVWGGALLLLPADAGRALVGPSWDETADVLLPLTLAMAGTGVVTGAAVGLRSLGAATSSLKARLIVSPFMLAGPVVGAVVGGASGAAYGLACVIWLSVAIWWRLFVDALAAYRTPSTSPRPDVIVAQRASAGRARGARTT
ncbi:MAG TPA: hypothetical protein VG479_10345 [Gaiellaceae bacterium]|jgi:hypothetical protein|nr:hypothetical protein [Gaiellaceae bacterium]